MATERRSESLGVIASVPDYQIWQSVTESLIHRTHYYKFKPSWRHRHKFTDFSGLKKLCYRHQEFNSRSFDRHYQIWLNFGVGKVTNGIWSLL